MQPGVAVRDYLKQTVAAFPQAEWWDLNVKLFFGLFSEGFLSSLFFLPAFFVCVECILDTFKNIINLCHLYFKNSQGDGSQQSLNAF